MKKKGHIIKHTSENGIAREMGIEAGDRLLQINGEEITDIFDYQYLVQDEYIEALVEKADGEQWLGKSVFWRSRRSLGRIWGWSLRTA